MAKRVQINVSEETWDELEKLKNDLHKSTISEVIRGSIRMTQYLEEETKQGKKVMLIDEKNGEKKELVFL